MKKLFEARNIARQESLQCNTRPKKKKVQRLRVSYRSTSEEEFQTAVDMKDMKTFFTGLREIYDPKPRGLIQLKAPDDESVLQGKDKILDRFADHFDQQLKTTPEILLRRLKRPLCNDQLHQVWMNHEISMNQWQLSAQHRMVKLQEGMEFQQNCYLNVTCGLWSVTSKNPNFL